MRALPYTFRNMDAPDGAVVEVTVEGAAGGRWAVARRDSAWVQSDGASEKPAATFQIGQDSAWKLFTKRMDRDTALARFREIAIGGDRVLGSRVLDMVSVMA
jgi:hypothetical protein